MAVKYEKLCVRGYQFTRTYVGHIYKETAVGEMLVCSKEPRNSHDKYAVAVEENGTVIGHLPKKCHVFVRCC